MRVHPRLGFWQGNFKGRDQESREFRNNGNIFLIEGNSRKEWLMIGQKGQRRIEMSKLKDGRRWSDRHMSVVAISEKRDFR